MQVEDSKAGLKISLRLQVESREQDTRIPLCAVRLSACDVHVKTTVLSTFFSKGFVDL